MAEPPLKRLRPAESTDAATQARLKDAVNESLKKAGRALLEALQAGTNPSEKVLQDVGPVVPTAVPAMHRVEASEDESGLVKFKGQDCEHMIEQTESITGQRSRVSKRIDAFLEEQKGANAELDDELPLSEDEGWADIVDQSYDPVDIKAQTKYFKKLGGDDSPMYAVQRAVYEYEVTKTRKVTDVALCVFVRSAEAWDVVYASLNGTSRGTVTLAPEMLACFAP
eukprot:TRINITY_DN90405_c0_g1_i1.p1 TRINITY_DN90405_c0_g1~~TRINITY_DN90405_c0_g1_i1.p1  ORF type:complete len:241 (+),score=35.41 TRINITY_DN90405_c0_g1_i1:51-725(+)